MGFRAAILDSNSLSPAGQVTPFHVLYDWNSLPGTVELAKQSTVVTLENEWADPNSLLAAEHTGASVVPHPRTLSIIGDKFVQRSCLLQQGLPSPQFRALKDWDDVCALFAEWGSVVIKSRWGGYDGYGVKVIRSRFDLDNLPTVEAASWYAEELIPFDVELAVIVSKNESGESAVYPVVESRQTRDGNRCDIVIAPAPGLTQEQSERAKQVSLDAVNAVGGIGIYGVELFKSGDRITINEIAPRPHNSGHYTMDGCRTSQFEQHVRSVLNLPPGSTALVAPVVVMANLLAPKDGNVDLDNSIESALKVCPDVHIHWYGKNEMRKGRKMGHLNLLGESLESTLERILDAREAFWEGSN